MFSVVIPVYNHDRYLVRAVTSAIQSKLVTEILLADDGSSDQSRDIVSKLAKSHSRVVRDFTTRMAGNVGAHARLNDLIGETKSPWIAVLNSDDEFFPGRFETIASTLKLQQVDFIFGNILILNEGNEILGRKRGPFDPQYGFPSTFDVHKMVSARQYLPLLLNQNYIATTSNMVFRKSLHAELGGFAPYRYVHDWDFALKAISGARAYYISQFLTLYRVHSRNTILEEFERQCAEARAMFQEFSCRNPMLCGDVLASTALGENQYLAAPVT